jgi:hypothetical protein
MIKLPEIIDATDILLNADAAGIDKIASISDEVTDIPSQEELVNIPMEKFACVIKSAHEGTVKKFPVHTKESTLLSMTALLHTHPTLPDEVVKTASANLLKAAYNWGIETNLEELKGLAKTAGKTNLVNLDKVDEKKYMQKTSAKEEGPSYKVFALEGRYPIDTPELMKRAEVYYRQYSDQFDPMEKYAYSRSMLKQAKAIDYHISNPAILKYANLRFEKNPNLEMQLRIRDTKTTTDGAYSEIAKIASKLSLEKLAEAILELDEQFGYTKYYDRMVPDPIFTVFNSLEKTSEAVNGKNITLENLRALSREDLKKYLNDDAIDELQGDKGIDVFKSLPEPVIEDIIGLI